MVIKDSKRDEIKLRLLFELIKMSRRSDIELSNIIGCTRTTIYRKRKELEEEKIIKEYTIVPDLVKLGYELCAFIFLTWVRHPNIKEIQIGKKWLAKKSEIIFCVAGEGFATNLIISLHKNFADFLAFINLLRTSTQPKLKDLYFFVIDLTRKECIYKDFSFRNLLHENFDIQQSQKKDQSLIG